MPAAIATGLANRTCCQPVVVSLVNVAWAKSAPWTGSYADERFNSINSFIFVDSSGAEHVVRWSLLPAAQAVPIAKDELAKRGLTSLMPQGAYTDPNFEWDEDWLKDD